MKINRKEFLLNIFGLCLVSSNAFANTKPSINTIKLLNAAKRQIGVTKEYDPAYTKIAYPMGDVSIEKGVCTDVIIRAYRDGLGIDLQKSIHEDMAKNFSVYPKIWGLKGTDTNIDHRRVPNIRKYLERKNASLAVSKDANDYKPGDLVTQNIYGRPHIGIISDQKTFLGTPLFIHNVGNGVQMNDFLFAFPITGHYRFGL